ncbi:MAG: transporter substrate-binding domain-containing protein [Alphaproteobacteria bacterium]|nr:transporter substrate-binding domain-containing protein [Alphaproteobacteria bacterium]
MSCQVLAVHGKADLKESSNSNALRADIQRIKQRKKLIVAMYGVDKTPFFMQGDDKKLHGIDVELAHRMAENLGVKVEINRQNQSFDEVVDQVNRGEADIGISMLSLTLLRAQRIKYTNPYVTLYKAVLFNRRELEEAKGSGRDSLQDIFNNNQRKIGVIKGSSYEVFARKIFPHAKILSFPSWETEIIPKLMSGELLAVFQDEWEIRKVIETIPEASLKLLAVTMVDELDSIRMIVPWESTGMMEWVNNFIKVENIHYTMDDLLVRYRKFKSQKKASQIR